MRENHGITCKMRGAIAGRVVLALLLVSAAVPPAVEAQTIEWTRQFGTSTDDVAHGISVDASGVYVAGETRGTLPGQTSGGNVDAFVRKYDFFGNEVWTRQFGASGDDVAHGISVDASGVYVAGETGGTLPGQTSEGGMDAFVRKYDFDGDEVWTRQFGSLGDDQALGIFVDASGVYLAGGTDDTLPARPARGSSTPLCASTTSTETRSGPASSEA